MKDLVAGISNRLRYLSLREQEVEKAIHNAQRAKEDLVCDALKDERRDIRAEIHGRRITLASLRSYPPLPISEVRSAVRLMRSRRANGQGKN